MSSSGKLDLKNGGLIVNYTSSTPYDNVFSLVGDGSAGGDWNGIGINSSTAAASSGRFGLAVAEAKDVFGISGSQTRTWLGRNVDATSVVVRFSYAGDSNLDGALNGDDYFVIDSNVLRSGSVFGYHNGDFNFDGEINGDDYFVLDANILAAQGHELLS
jgi:hypothetical protein